MNCLWQLFVFEDLLSHLTFPAGVGAALPSEQVACVPDEVREKIDRLLCNWL